MCHTPPKFEDIEARQLARELPRKVNSEPVNAYTIFYMRNRDQHEGR